jgi:hypothetical protein
MFDGAGQAIKREEAQLNQFINLKGTPSSLEKRGQGRFTEKYVQSIKINSKISKQTTAGGPPAVVLLTGALS